MSNADVPKELDTIKGVPLKCEQATTQNCPETEVVKLMKQFCLDTFDPIGDFSAEMKAKMRRALLNTDDQTLLATGLQSVDEYADTDERHFFEEFTANLNRNIKKMTRLISEGNVDIIREGDSVVAAVAVRNMGKLEDSREVYEFTEVIVLPSHRGRGLFTQLKESLTNRMRSQNPDVPLATVTEQEPVKRYCQSHGWKQKDLDFFADIMCREPSWSPSMRQEIRRWFGDKKTKPSWAGFIDDPLDR